MTMITPSYLGETIEYSSLHACRSTLEDPTIGISLRHVDWALASEPGDQVRTELVIAHAHLEHARQLHDLEHAEAA